MTPGLSPASWRRSIRNTRRITRSTSSTRQTTPAFEFRHPGHLLSPKPTSPAPLPAGPFHPRPADFCPINCNGSSAFDNDDAAGGTRTSRTPFGGEAQVSGPLGSANREIREADRRDQLRRRARLAEPRRLTDDLLHQLEELNLDGVGTVPDGYESDMAELRERLEALSKVRPRLIEQLQPGARTPELIDIVLIIQEIIAPPRLPSGSVAVEDTKIV